LRAKEDAERTLADKQSDVDEARARAELLQAVAQLGALRKLRGRH
jgi:F-type H+-transporting ATPase subunit epsilon